MIKAASASLPDFTTPAQAPLNCSGDTVMTTALLDLFDMIIPLLS
jgi:hypothetical protein